jgi:hypothetical protein
MNQTQDPAKISARFWRKVQKSDEGCWIWLSSLNSKGYGRFRDPLEPRKSKRVFAHRYSWQQTNGSIPDGMLVLHTCDNPKCVRPDHLFLGTHKDNAIDKMIKGRHQATTNPDCYMRGDALSEVRRRQPKPPRKRGHKLTRQQALEIQTSPASAKALSVQYNLTESMVYKIRKGSCWAAQPLPLSETASS